MKILAGLLCLLTLVGGMGCHRVTIKDSTTRAGDKHGNEWQMFLIYGLAPIGENPIEADKKCPNGLHQVSFEQSFLNGLVSMLSSGIITPVTIEYTCAEGGGAVTGGGTTL